MGAAGGGSLAVPPNRLVRGFLGQFQYFAVPAHVTGPEVSTNKGARTIAQAIRPLTLLKDQARMDANLRHSATVSYAIQ